MIASFRNFQSKMTAQNTRSALAFAVFSFLLVLIATFGVVYLHDLYPGYGTLVQIGPRIALYHNPNISTASKSETSTEKGKGSEPGKISSPSEATYQQTIPKEDPSISDPGFFDKVIAVFASVKSQPNGNTVTSPDHAKPADETTSGIENHIKFPGAVQANHKFDELSKLNPSSPDEEFKTAISPEKLSDANIPKSTTVLPNKWEIRPNNAIYGKSFYDRLREMVSDDLAGNGKRSYNRNERKKGTHTYEVQSPSSARRSKTQIFPPWIEKFLESSAESKIDPRTFSKAFSDLEKFFDTLDDELSSESFEIPEFSLVDLLDDAGMSLDVTEESDSDEREFSFGRNTRHFALSEKLPQFPRPAIDFPLNRNFRE